MIFLWFLTLLPLNEAVSWDIRNTGVFRPLAKEMVVLGEDDHVFLTSFERADILHFHGGAFAGLIGEKGMGPGEFRHMAYLAHQDNRLYAFGLPESTRIFSFNYQGELLTSFRPTYRFAFFPLKVSSGWIYINSSIDRQRRSLVFSDYHFQQEEEILVWREDSQPDSLAKTQLRVSRDGKTVFFHKPGAFEVHVIDATRRKIVKIFKKTVPPIPVAESWLALKQAEREKMLRDFNRITDTGKIIPEEKDRDYFPHIKEISIGPDRTALIYYNLHFVFENEKPLIINAEGTPIESSFSAEALRRIIDIKGDWAYVTTFSNEEAGLAKIKTKLVQDFIARNPIEPR